MDGAIGALAVAAVTAGRSGTVPRGPCSGSSLATVGGKRCVRSGVELRLGRASVACAWGAAWSGTVCALSDGSSAEGRDAAGASGAVWSPGGAAGDGRAADDGIMSGDEICAAGIPGELARRSGPSGGGPPARQPPSAGTDAEGGRGAGESSAGDAAAHDCASGSTRGAPPKAVNASRKSRALWKRSAVGRDSAFAKKASTSGPRSLAIDDAAGACSVQTITSTCT